MPGSWRARPELLFYELAVFNGWLYLGSFDPATGYSVAQDARRRNTPLPVHHRRTRRCVPSGSSEQVRRKHA